MNDTTKLWLARLTVPALLVGALIASIYWGNGYRVQASSYENHIDGLYKKSFIELQDNMRKIETSLAKVLVVNSPSQYAMMLSDIWRSSGSAVGVLSQLPGAYTDFSPLNKLLVELGDFCYQLERKVTGNTPLTEEEKAQLVKLHNASATVNQQLQENLDNGQIDAFLSTLSNMDYYADAPGGAVSFKQEEGKDTYPQLIYDGPFSDSTKKAEPEGLPPEEVDVQTAQQAAQEFLKELCQEGLTPSGETNGRMPTYNFEGKTPEGKRVDISVTKQGGKVKTMRVECPTEQTQVPDAERGTELSNGGLEFLKARGFESMISTYGQYYGGEGIINYAFVQDGAVVYEDLIKVWVHVQTGAICGYDATNYLFSHKPRELPVEIITPEQAQELVNTDLEIVQVRRAFIPLTPQEEKLCYEFKGKYGENSFIVYIDAVTGEEQQVFMIIDSQEGQLVL